MRALGLILAAALAASMASGVVLAIDCPAACDDGNPCNGIETCDTTTGQCQAGQPPSCDDGDPCTVDSCDPSGGCIHLPLTGLGALTCRLSVLRGNLGVALDLLRGTPARDLGGVAVKQRLVADVVAMQGIVERLTRFRPLDRALPGPAGLRLLARRLKTLCRLAARFARTVERGVERGTIDPALGARLVALAAPDLAACRPVVFPRVDFIATPSP